MFRDLDLSPRELVLMLPLVWLTLYYGVHPQPILDASMAAVDGVVKTVASTEPAPKTAALVPGQD